MPAQTAASFASLFYIGITVGRGVCGFLTPIHQAILHVLDTTMDAPVLSGGPMELTAEKNAYLQNHIEKLLASDDIRQCRPLPDSAFKNELEHNQDFVDLSCRIAGVLFDYMHAHTTIPGADLAVVDFTWDGAPWLGILKLNYKNGYTHYTETVEGAPVNSIIQQRACLPTQSGKVEEGALVDLTDYSMRLLAPALPTELQRQIKATRIGLEPTTPSVTGWCSNQLSYRAIWWKLTGSNR